MRLAADYQQRTKKPEEPHPEGRKYIVRLGRGLPNEQRRRRGISLSQADSRLSQHSLGKDEVSREKHLEQISHLNTNSVASQPAIPPKTLVSTAAHVAKPRRNPDNYANEHLLTLQPQQPAEPQQPQSKYLSGVRSQQTIVRRESQQKIALQPIQQIVRQAYIPPQRILTVLVDPRLPYAEKRTPTHPPPQLSQQSSNLLAQDSIVKSPQELYRSNPASKTVMVPVRRLEEKPSTPCLVQTRKTEQLGDTMRNIQKVSSNNDPYNLVSSKLTRKNGGHPEEEPELTETRKYLRNLPECKEISGSSSVSEQSRQGVMISRTNLRSLWDANKVQSIMSMKESREIKVQESQIVLDYFNPSESQLRKL